MNYYQFCRAKLRPANETLMWWVMRMQIILFMIVGAVAQLSAAHVVAQTVTLRAQNQSLESVVKSIREQSGHDILYNPGLLNKEAKPVTIDLQGASLKEALDAIFKQQTGLDYVIDQGAIVIRHTEAQKAALPVAMILAYPEVRGKVTDSLGRPLQGATVRVLDAEGKRTALQTSTDRHGEFLLRNVPELSQLEISYVGYISRTVIATGDLDELVLRAVPSALEEVEVMVNTGYQTLSKERATGSFTHVTSEELNLRTGSTLLSRLEDIVPGLQINRIGNAQINLRGLSTFSGSAANDVLVILDQFPYEGDLKNINPDDIESITVLKDAAATSIWGARAGHGVIVINTKKPQISTKERPLNVSFSGNLSVSPPVDLAKEPRILSSDFIDLEIELFEKGHYDTDFADPDQRRKVYSPVISLLEQVRSGVVDEDEAMQAINEMRYYDYRKDLMNHVYRNAINQQYGMNVSGGNDISSYLLSAGYAAGYGNINESGSNNRFNVRASNRFKPHRKVQLQSELNYTLQSDLTSDAYLNVSNIRPGESVGGLYPYAQLMGDDGQPLTIPYQYHPNFVDTAGNGSFLDWTYKPLDISNKSWSSKLQRHHMKMNVDATYELLKGWTAAVTYGHERETGIGESHESQDQFNMRDRINLFSNFSRGNLVRPLPLGGMYTASNSSMKSHRVRLQSNLNRVFGNRHSVAALAGAEASNKVFVSNGYRRYGYDDDTYTVAAEIDYITIYPTYGGVQSSQRLGQSVNSMRHDTQRYLSFFGNASYTYDNKYIVSLSARKDASNVFGIKANDRWNPLWSAGLSWNATNEHFLQTVTWLDQLKLRITYGHSGKPPHGAAVRPILNVQNNTHQMYRELPNAIINNPANPRLKWEDIQMTNFAVDFSLFSRKLYGSVDFYLKRSTDIITSSALPLVTGRPMIDANVGDMKGRGFEIQLNSTNELGRVRWNKQFSFSFSKNEVVKVNVTNPLISTYVGGSSGILLPMEGRSLYPVFMFRTAGLDHNTGYPIGYLNGNESFDYSQILSKTTIDQAVYHGTLLPPYYGFFRNSFSYRQLDLSFNVAFRFGHVFVRETFDGSITGWGGHSDYYRRWQAPGDEAYTDVPVYVYPEVAGMMNFYRRSSSVVESGDGISLREGRIAYQMDRTMLRSLGATSVSIFANVTDFELSWKAIKKPDNRIPAVSPGVSLGIQANWK